MKAGFSVIVAGDSSIDELTNNHIIDNSNGVGTGDAAAIDDADDNWFGTSNFEDTSNLDDEFFDGGDEIEFSQWAGAPIDPDAGEE